MPIVTEVHDADRIKPPIYIEVQSTTRPQTNTPSERFSKDPSIKSPDISFISEDRMMADFNETPIKTKWTTAKKIFLALFIISLASVIILIVVLSAVLATRTTINTTTTTTTTTTTAPPIISATWLFDSSVADSYGVYHGTLMNGASYSSPSTTQPYLGIGRALSLSSSSSQSVLISTPFLNMAYRSFTIEAWIYSVTSYVGDSSIFGQCQCSTCANQCLYFIVRGGRLYAGFIFNDIGGSTTLNAAVWYHVTFVYNADTQQQILYINGIQDAIKFNAAPYQGTTGSIQIGSTSASLAPNYFNGYIDNVKITTRAKSASEILQDASLIAYYSFDLSSSNLDNGPNGLDGLSVNTAIVLGRVNKAMSFTGVSSYFQAYGFYQAGYGVNTGQPFSISMWINPSSIVSSAFVQQSTTQTGGSCLNMIGIYSAASLTAQLIVQTNGYSAIFGPYITINTWTHFSWTYSPTNGATLYVNGISFGSTGSYTVSNSGAITWLQIGYNFACALSGFINNGPYDGAIDEIYIHNRELAQTDVTALANP